MSKQLQEIQKICEELKNSSFSRDELANLKEDELQEILSIALFIEGLSDAIVRVVDEKASPLPSFLQKTTDILNASAEFKNWYQDISELRSEDVYKAKKKLELLEHNIKVMHQVVDNEIEKFELLREFWGFMESDQ